MASEDPMVTIEPAAEAEATKPEEDNPEPKVGKTKKAAAAAAKETKAKKPAGAKKPRTPPTHPPYLQVMDLRI